MSAVPAVTMQDLQLERAELLPHRETLYLCETYLVNPGSPSHSCPPPPAAGYTPPPAGSCPPPPHAGDLAGTNLVACPM
jgi:hypothetical protein